MDVEALAEQKRLELRKALKHVALSYLFAAPALFLAWAVPQTTSIDFFFPMLVLLFGFLAFYISGALAFARSVRLRQELRVARRTRADRMETATIADRISKLTENLKESHRLIEELTAELRVRGEALERLAAEAEEKRHLAALHADEAAAVDALVNRRIQENVQRLERGSLRQQWLFFIIGTVVLAIPFGVAGNFVFEWLK